MNLSANTQYNNNNNSTNDTIQDIDLEGKDTMINTASSKNTRISFSISSILDNDNEGDNDNNNEAEREDEDEEEDDDDDDDEVENEERKVIKVPAHRATDFFASSWTHFPPPGFGHHAAHLQMAAAAAAAAHPGLFGRLLASLHKMGSYDATTDCISMHGNLNRFARFPSLDKLNYSCIHFVVNFGCCFTLSVDIIMSCSCQVCMLFHCQ